MVKSFLVVLLLVMWCGCTKSAPPIVAVHTEASWTPEMCHVEQPSPVSEAYIRYCIKVSPDEYPMCTTSGQDPRAAMWTAQAAIAEGKSGAYFEVLDCSWHSGKNPRESGKMK